MQPNNIGKSYHEPAPEVNYMFDKIQSGSEVRLDPDPEGFLSALRQICYWGALESGVIGARLGPCTWRAGGQTPLRHLVPDSGLYTSASCDG